MNILSLSGGGSKGYISAKLLQKLEESTGKQCYELFDFCSGVSTGSIVGAMLSRSVPAKDIAEFYRTKAPEIFKNKRCFLLNLFKSKYNKKNLEKVLKEYLNVPFSTMKMKTMIYAARIDKPNSQAVFWKSWNDIDFNENTADIVQASSSAPTFFEPHYYDGAYYADGAFIANNPTMCCIAEALRLGKSLNEMYVVNIELENWKGFEKANKIDSIFDWITKIWDLCVSMGVAESEYQAHQLLGFRNHSIKVNESVDADSLDFDRMDKIAEAAWEEHKDALIDWLGKI